MHLTFLTYKNKLIAKITMSVKGVKVNKYKVYNDSASEFSSDVFTNLSQLKKDIKQEVEFEKLLNGPKTKGHNNDS